MLETRLSSRLKNSKEDKLSLERLGQYVRETRKKLGLRQEDISSLDKSEISRLENGRILPSLQNFKEIAQSLKTTPGHLVNIWAGIDDNSLERLPNSIAVNVLLDLLEANGLILTQIVKRDLPELRPENNPRRIRNEQGIAKVRDTRNKIEELRLELSKTETLLNKLELEQNITNQKE